MTLTEFLLARIAEERDTWEREARRGRPRPPTPIPTWNPDRRLAHCEAMQRVVALHVMREPRLGRCRHPDCNEMHGPSMPPACEECSMTTGPYGCQTLRILALPYADHPDYREEWRP